MPRSETDSAERRRCPRSPVSLWVRILDEGNGEALGEGATRDLSPCGMLAECEMTQGLRPGQRLRVRFPVFDGCDAGVELPCSVRRIEDESPLRFAGEFASEPPAYLVGPELMGVSGALTAVKQSMLDVAAYDVNVLLLGESGTGKNVLAGLIHRHSPRAAAPFIRVNCPAIPETLLSSQLFGNVKGAYTGAESARPGLFRIADGGTILLDEISAIPPAQQAKLLEVIESKRFIPVGAQEPVEVDVRIIATTNRDATTQMEGGALRDDLYFRLNEISFELPPLRERPEDIPILTSYFAHEYCLEFDKPHWEPAESVIRAFQQYDWPGNVRELEHTIKRGLLTGRFWIGAAKGGETRAAPESAPACAQGPRVECSAPLEDIRRQAERNAVLAALHASGGDTRKAASMLEISPRTCRRKISELLERHDPVLRRKGPGVKQGRLPEDLPGPQCPLTSPIDPGGLSLEEVRRRAEVAAIRRALEEADANRTRAAARLGISYRTLLRKMQAHGIEV